MQNGIVENFLALRNELLAEGYTFNSDTDTEVIVHLISREYHNGVALEEAVRRALRQLRGPSAVVVLSSHEPDKLITARLGNAGAVVIGHGEGEMFIASDIPAILEHTHRMSFLESRDLAVVTCEGVDYFDLNGNPLPDKPMHHISWDPVAAAKGTYRHFMQKEIFEQTTAITDTIRGRVDFVTGAVTLSELNLDAEAARAIDKVTIVACGTSYYAGLVGKFLIENLARLSTEVDYGSEYRYRHPVLDRNSLVLAITQSGETVDTLAALEEARVHHSRTAAIVNAMGSQAARVADGIIYMHAGPKSASPAPRLTRHRWWICCCLQCTWGSSAARLTPPAPWRSPASWPCFLRSWVRCWPMTHTTKRWLGATPTTRTSSISVGASITPPLWRAP